MQHQHARTPCPHCPPCSQVAPDYRRQRLAQKLMNSLEEVTEKVGRALLVLPLPHLLLCGCAHGAGQEWAGTARDAGSMMDAAVWWSVRLLP